jgi:hypothetical protein
MYGNQYSVITIKIKWTVEGSRIFLSAHTVRLYE